MALYMDRTSYFRREREDKKKHDSEVGLLFSLMKQQAFATNWLMMASMTGCLRTYMNVDMSLRLPYKTNLYRRFDLLESHGKALN